MRIRALILCLAGAAVLAVASLPILLASSGESPHRLRLTACRRRPSADDRGPEVAQAPTAGASRFSALNKGQEVSDLFSSYGVLVNRVTRT